MYPAQFQNREAEQIPYHEIGAGNRTENPERDFQAAEKLLRRFVARYSHTIFCWYLTDLLHGPSGRSDHLVEFVR